MPVVLLLRRSLGNLLLLFNFIVTTTSCALRALTPSAQSDMMAKRMKRIERIGTDSDSPSAHLSAAGGIKIRSNPLNPFHPFYHHAAFSKENGSLKVNEAPKSAS
ncbi:hypothetical protein [Haliscomenobacter hydrossis]|uniref:hypothetical protein n=1 Tax=Haliscomenobacter hydrossis TaxID=2350 RepID=UPI0005C69DE4|nr:hypothetical protein [Haliscomenobacter hydrossis]